MEQKGIKEVMELLAGLEVVAVAAKKALADGKVNLEDAKVLFDLIDKLAVLVEAVKGADQIPAEVKDLTGEELQAIAAKVLQVVASVKAA